jgi:hypothetical protein
MVELDLLVCCRPNKTSTHNKDITKLSFCPNLNIPFPIRTRNLMATSMAMVSQSMDRRKVRNQN